MAQCHYHPEARASANCAVCRHHICDRCRLNGNGGRCEACSRAAAKGGNREAEPGERARRLKCLNHKDVPVDSRCRRCKKPHCPACLNGAQHCFRCALEPDAPRKNRGTGALPRRGTGKLGGMTASLPPMPGGRRPPAWAQAMLGALVVVVVVGLAGWAHRAYTAATAPPPPPPPYAGPVGVAILQPRNQAQLTGNVWIKLDVKAASHLDHVALTVDGKHWERFEKAPFATEWPSQITRNGRHVIEARVVYRGKKKTARARAVVYTRNRFG
ncbi:MAG: Ig-like domain-containing protein [Candidatus Sericytochromatia bacterium]|nr:Ig-like domain-containing protein [Candidatus Sericytochromatia bacterium]